MNSIFIRRNSIPKGLGFALLVTAVCLAVFGSISSKAADLQRTYVADYTPVTLTDFPTSIAASTTASSEQIIDVRRHPTIAVQITGQLTGTNPAAATLVIPWHRSVDGSSFETTPVNYATLTFTGVLSRTFVTNITVGDSGYIKFLSPQNTATNVATNLVVKIVGKPPWALTWPYGGR